MRPYYYVNYVMVYSIMHVKTRLDFISHNWSNLEWKSNNFTIMLFDNHVQELNQEYETNKIK